MTCTTCKNLKSGPLTRQGFNLCAISPRWESFPLEHSCAKYIQEVPELLAKRIAWLEASGAIARQPAPDAGKAGTAK